MMNNKVEVEMEKAYCFAQGGCWYVYTWNEDGTDSKFGAYSNKEEAEQMVNAINNGWIVVGE